MKTIEIQSDSFKKAIRKLYETEGSALAVKLRGFYLGEYPGDDLYWVFDVFDAGEEL